MIHSEIKKPQCTQCDLNLFCSYNTQAGVKPRQRFLKRKEILHAANDAFTTMYSIQRGALKAYETDPAGNELIRGLYLKNEVYGYDAIFKGVYPFATTALTETVVCEISYQNFLEIIHSKPDLIHRVLYLVSQQLIAGSYFKYITAQQRLASFLIDLSIRLSCHESRPDFVLPMSYQDIGNYLGLATETVSRILSQFKNSEMISIENKHVYILQKEDLKRVADGF